MTRRSWNLAAAAAVVSLAVGAAQALAVEYANIDVVDGAEPTISTPPTVNIPAGQKTANFFIDGGSVVGEIPIRIGVNAADDAAGGILVATPRETSRFASDYGAGATKLLPSVSTVFDSDVSSTNTRDLSGAVALVIDRAGGQNSTAPYTAGSPMNANLAAAYFPFSEGWKGGTAWSSTGIGTIDSFQGSPGITFDPTIGAANTANVRPNHVFIPPYDISDVAKNGDHFVSIPGVVDSRQQGILLAMSAKNEDNFAGASALNTGEGWIVNTRGNAQDGPGNGESDNFSFVFVPLGTPNVTMATIWGAAGIDRQPTPLLQSGNNFSIATYPAGGNGNFRLTIDGHTPNSGVLIVQTQATGNGDGGLPGDNLVTYRPDGDGWIIVSDDLPTADDAAGQNGQSDEFVPYFHFVFLPFNAQPTAPAAIPAPAWTKSSVFGYKTDVTEILATGNNQDDANGPDLTIAVASATNGVNVKALALNRGDNRLHVSGAIPTVDDGIMLASISEGFRDNTATGGVRGYGNASAYVSGQGQWVTATFVADQFAGQRLQIPVSIAGEANYDFSMAFFGRDTGFPMGTVEPQQGGTGLHSITVPGVNSLTDGVLMANNAANEDNYVTVTPKFDGSGWDVQNWDNGGFVQNFGVNYVYLPFETDNLVAARVNPDGSLAASTPSNEFSLTRESAGTYLLTVNGRNSSQGMLLLTAEALDHTLAYEPAGNSFRIFALDPVNQAEYEGTAAEMTLVDTNFQFAFIDYITPPTLGGPAFLAADFNNSGTVDAADFAAWKGGFGTAAGAAKTQGDANADGRVDGADFLVWQQQLGGTSSVPTAGAVPEPNSALALFVASLVLGCGARRRKLVR